MARLPDSEINQLKTSVSLHDLVESSGIPLKKQGKDYLGHCPFHDDKTPSLVISPDKNLWHCLGACSEGGDVIQWVMKRENLAFREAVAWLRSDLAEFEQQSLSQSNALLDDEAENKTRLVSGSDASDSVDSCGSGSSKTKKSKSLNSANASKSITPLAANPDDQALLSQILDYYHETLKRTPKALDYLESRGLMHPELISHFHLGFADYSLSELIPPSKVKAGAEVRDQLKQIGILRANGQAHFTGCLVFPVRCPDNHVIGEVYGRRISASVKAGRPLHLYLPHAH